MNDLNKKILTLYGKKKDDSKFVSMKEEDIESAPSDPILNKYFMAGYYKGVKDTNEKIRKALLPF